MAQVTQKVPLAANGMKAGVTARPMLPPGLLMWVSAAARGVSGPSRPGLCTHHQEPMHSDHTKAVLRVMCVSALLLGRRPWAVAGGPAGDADRSPPRGSEGKTFPVPAPWGLEAGTQDTF